jgi:phospholipid/cholesterol/gamma-HCH transport system substrate-binding protein
VAKENWTLPIQNTLPDINADEVYSALDADTRDYLGLLINGAGQGLKGRGGDLRQVFMRFEPTHRDLARVSTAVAQRNGYLRRLITSLHVLNHELATRQNDVSSLIDASSVVFRAFASEDTQISRAIGDFPGALSQTTDTLNKVTTFANVLGPTAEALRPAVRALNGANLALVPFANATTPVLQNQIRPFIRDARPLVRSLRPASINLAKATPDLTSVFTVLNHLFNMLAYNPNTSNAAYNGANAASYLFWLAWVSHDGTNLFSTADANGPFRPVALGLSCQSIFNQLQATQAQDPTGGLTALTTLAENLTPLLAAGGVCGH